MNAIVEADEKGRILLPIELRRKFNSKRFEVTTKAEEIILKPVAGIEELKGKYRTIIKSDWEELEERGEDFVEKGRR
jgi:bifunctional DNA-binding transcriptional regulator/antitoxin component of YhaV-PrlF toxin-antitoxin module